MDDNETTNTESELQTQEIVNRVKSSYPIEVIDSPESPRLDEVAEIDAKAFNGQVKLTKEDFVHIFQNGGIILAHVGPDDKLISEATLLLATDPEGKSLLERDMPGWLAYCDGAAVVEEFRSRGLQKELLEAREAVAKESNKEASAASVRQNNLGSIKSMLGEGYLMVADSHHYYGDEEKDARVIMLKDFTLFPEAEGSNEEDRHNPLRNLKPDDERLKESLKGVVEPKDLGAKLKPELKDNPDLISVAVVQSETVNSEYNLTVSTLLKSGYIGVACNDINIGDSDGERSDAMTFVKLSTLPLEVQDRLRLRQKEIQSIVS